MLVTGFVEVGFLCVVEPLGVVETLVGLVVTGLVEVGLLLVVEPLGVVETGFVVIGFV